MDGGYVQGNPRRIAIGEIEQSCLQGLVIQVSPATPGGAVANLHPGMAGQAVKMIQPVLGQQVVNEEAALAAEMVVFFPERFIRARLSAVKTGDDGACGLLLARHG
jgi:hypothetical protein